MTLPFVSSPSTRLFALFTFSIALAGCSLAPTYERPALPIETAYPSGEAYAVEPTTQTHSADIGWRDFFLDPLLQQLIALSLNNNRDLRTAALNVEAARAQYRIQRADLLPTLDATAQSTAQRLPADLSNDQTAGITRGYHVAGTVSWELDLWGRIRNLNQQAFSTYMALNETYLATQLSLMSEVANAYFTLRADQALLALTQQTLATQLRTVDLTSQKLNAGEATQIDMQRANIALHTAEANVALYTRQAAQDRNALVLLLGQPLNIELSQQLARPPVLSGAMLLTHLPAGIPSDLLTRRPDIRAAEHQLRGANARIGAARAAFFPAISLTGTAGTASAHLDGLFEGGSGTWSFIPRISLPIFNSGALRANVDVAEIRKQLEITHYEKTIQTAFTEVADHLAATHTLAQQIHYETQRVEANQKAYELAEQRYREGWDDSLSLLDAQRSLYSSQQSLLQTQLQHYSTVVNLYKALGGGWTEQTIQSVPPTPSAS